MRNAWCLLVLAFAPAVAGVSAPALVDAAFDGDAVRVGELIASGADVNAADPDGLTALHAAAGNGRADIVRALLRAGASPNPARGSPLGNAVEGGSLDCVRLLVDAGADMRAKVVVGFAGLPSGETDMIGLALSNERRDIVRFLVDRGALTATANNVNVRVRDRPTAAGSNALATLQKGDVVTVLGRAATEVAIGDTWDFWLKVRLRDGTVGYSFGQFLDVPRMSNAHIPPFFDLAGSRWGPPRPSFGFILDLDAGGMYRLSFAGEGGGQESRGTWKVEGEAVVLTRQDSFREEYLPAWARESGSAWRVADDPENPFYQYRLTNTTGDSLWSHSFPVQLGARLMLQGQTVLAEAGREVVVVADAKVRERPGATGPTQVMEFWSPATGAARQDYVPKGYPVQLLGRTERPEVIQGKSDSWYYVRISVEDDAYGHEYLGWIQGAQLRK